MGAVGIACTVGTAAYEHWDELKAFFTGDEVETDPTLLNILPDEGEGIILEDGYPRPAERRWRRGPLGSHWSDLDRRYRHSQSVGYRLELVLFAEHNLLVGSRRWPAR